MLSKETALRKRVGIAEVRRITGRCTRTVDRWEASGFFPAAHMIGPPKAQRRAWFEDELLVWQAQQMARQEPARTPGAVKR